MTPIVAIIAPGAMGAAVARRLTGNGIEVRTSLEGRSTASAGRAEAAGMRAVADAALAGVDIVLSIVPPGEALALAGRLAPILARGARRPLYADCNAVSPQTAEAVGAVVSGAGLRFVDAGIIGGPPEPDTPGPVFYASGPDAAALQVLSDHGVRVRVLDGPVGAASGLKMSYAGITKGMTALAAAMVLAATRFGAADDLRRELAESQPELLARFGRALPDMVPKAYRWVAEMEEIAAFAGEDPASRQIYEGIARLYDRLARDQEGRGRPAGGVLRGAGADLMPRGRSGLSGLRGSTHGQARPVAARLGLSVGTVRDWEQARVVPDRPAQALLRVIEAEPETVRRMLKGAWE